MTHEERKEALCAALAVLKTTLVETETSMAVSGNRLIFFGTEDYMRQGSIKQIPKFAVSIEQLVK